jgi:hypothetical protein
MTHVSVHIALWIVETFIGVVYWVGGWICGEGDGFGGCPACSCGMRWGLKICILPDASILPYASYNCVFQIHAAW